MFRGGPAPGDMAQSNCTTQPTELSSTTCPRRITTTCWTKTDQGRHQSRSEHGPPPSICTT
eukprot:1513180-Pyramimonas_sp.AAC.1